MFSALRQGSIIYILDKGITPVLKIGEIISVSSPNTYAPYLSNSTVDISVKTGDQTSEFKSLPSQSSIANYDNGNIIVSESRELMSNEVESMIRQSKLILESVPKHEEIVNKGEEMLKQINPQFAKEKDLEEKINNLETKVGNVENKIDDIYVMLSKALNK